MSDPKEQARALRKAVEALLNDRKGLHWCDLDGNTLNDLRRAVDDIFLAVLAGEVGGG